jgi:hypothetical protein
MLKTNYFLPDQALEMKGQSVKTVPTVQEPAKLFEGIRAQIRGQN